MTRFWRGWLEWWCVAVGAFGLLLAGAAVEATAGAARALLAFEGGDATFAFTRQLHFAVALMGCVTLGWSVTLLATFRAAEALGAGATSTWRLASLGVVGWYVLDSALSVATGFAWNVAPNTLLLVAFLVPVLRTGVLQTTEAARSA